MLTNEEWLEVEIEAQAAVGMTGYARHTGFSKAVAKAVIAALRTKDRIDTEHREKIRI